MKKIFFPFLLIFFFSINTYSQYVHKIKADSVLITNDSCTAELNLENSTKNVNGFLYNKGKGRTEFRKGLIKIDDTLYIIGNDTLNIAKGIAFGNYIKNQNTTAQTANAWINASLNIGGSAFDSNYKLNLYQSSTSLGTIKATIPNGSVLTHNGTEGVLTLKADGTNTNTYVQVQSSISQFLLRNSSGSLMGGMVHSNGSFSVEGMNAAATAGIVLGIPNNVATSGLNYGIRINPLSSISFSPTSGSASYAALAITPGINQTGTSNGNIYGLYYSPSLTSVLGTHYFLYAPTGNNILNGASGSTVIGDGFTNATSKLTINPYSAAGGYLMSVTGVTIQRGALNMDMTNWTPSAPAVINISGTNPYMGGSGIPLVNIDVTQSNTAYAVTGYSSKIYRTAATGAGYSTTEYKADVDGYGGNTYGFYSKAVTSATSPNGKAYAFYGEAGLNYFADKVLIGSTADAGNYKLQVTGNTLVNGTTTSTILKLPGGYTMSEAGTTATINSNGFNTIYDLGSNGIPTFKTTNGVFTIERSVAPLVTQILWLKNTAAGTKSDFIIGNINDNVFLNEGTVKGNHIGTNTFVTTGGVTLPGNNLYGISWMFDNQLAASNPNAIWLYDSNNNVPFLVKKNGNILMGSSVDVGAYKLQVTGNAYINGKQSIGTTSNTALLHLAAGTAAANTAPLKFTSGTNLATPENGTVEFDGTNYFVTSANTRYTLAKTLTATETLDFTNTAAQSSSNLTVTLTGAADGDAVSLGIPNSAVNDNSSYSAWVSAANTVTIRFNNYSSAAIDPANGTFRISVIKY